MPGPHDPQGTWEGGQPVQPEPDHTAAVPTATLRFLVLLAVLGVLAAAAAAAPDAAWVGPPFTLRAGVPDPGESLRCLVSSSLHAQPARDSPVLTHRGPGDEVRVVGTAVRGRVSWIETADGWLEAARVDRRPFGPVGALLPGREGMAAGRILPWDWRPADLSPVPDRLKAPGFQWRAMELRADALDAFGRLVDAAAADGIRLGIVSAFRSAAYQRRLYARAVTRDPAQRTSAAPGRSEHQLGTTADVTERGVPPFRPELADSPAGRWIERRAAEFGIVVTYSRARHESRGVAHEPWHLRWVGDAAGEPGGW